MAMFPSEFISIKDIRPNLKNINTVFIILEVGAATVTKENRVVRTFKVGDPTAVINVSVWDEPGNLLVPGDIVRLTKGYAAIWRHCLTLYSGKNGDIHKVGEFCMNFNEHLNMSEPNPNLTTPVNATTQKNQATSSTVLINNGTSSNSSNNNSNNSNNGNSVTITPTTSIPPSIAATTTSGTSSSNSVAATVKTTGSNRGGGATTGEHSKTSTSKTTARGARTSRR
ncbi:SOSS complex subunit B homolog isoform X2 [Contarinia nasturtii]|uniref:SOSS complex subunit B homolog isoform X2 n=1 Tax=Contarinia nasturtii TaxID=265458 RepID=UPI0012D486F1|nr:SOSS complex subunit B homolog isoform X2 [Contarinia nasturtii]